MPPIQQTRLYQEIHEQPRVISSLVAAPQPQIKALAKRIRAEGIRHVFIAARGTSDNAGRYAKYLLGAHNQLVVSLAAPSLFTVYQQPPDLTGSLVLGISQSGKSPDIVSVIKEGRRQGALTAAITNTPNSDLGSAAEFVIDLCAGEERSLAATKTYSAQLISLALLSEALNPSPARHQEISLLADRIPETFRDEERIQTLAERFRYMTHCVVIGRGFNYATAFEFSLKLKELTYSIAEPYSSADFLHGPVALVDRGFPIFIFAPHGKMIPEMNALIKTVQSREAEIVLLSDHQALFDLADHAVTLPTDVPEWLSPITAIIPAQLFAMYLAHARGYDVDNPRGLNKVTETW